MCLWMRRKGFAWPMHSLPHALPWLLCCRYSASASLGRRLGILLALHLMQTLIFICSTLGASMLHFECAAVIVPRIFYFTLYPFFPTPSKYARVHFSIHPSIHPCIPPSIYSKWDIHTHTPAHTWTHASVFLQLSSNYKMIIVFASSGWSAG